MGRAVGQGKTLDVVTYVTKWTISAEIWGRMENDRETKLVKGG
jgi:hypothetical protein